jgi:hypothetical protein
MTEADLGASSSSASSRNDLRVETLSMACTRLIAHEHLDLPPRITARSRFGLLLTRMVPF